MVQAEGFYIVNEQAEKFYIVVRQLHRALLEPCLRLMMAKPDVKMSARMPNDPNACSTQQPQSEKNQTCSVSNSQDKRSVCLHALAAWHYSQ
jgi:hypothetical protein